jgi:hypothetical protein
MGIFANDLGAAAAHTFKQCHSKKRKEQP